MAEEKRPKPARYGNKKLKGFFKNVNLKQSGNRVKKGGMGRTFTEANIYL